MFRSIRAALCGPVAAAVFLAPGVAHAGFFDQLFGGGTVTAPQPSYEAPPTPDSDTTIERPHVKKKFVVRDQPPARQKTTDLMSDRTLHPGDAIMMKDGLHIYNGPEAAKHTARQFVPIDRSKNVSSKTRATLLAMDMMRVDPLKKEPGSQTLASGRSAAVTTPVSKGFQITDARGKSIRYVGP